MSIVVRRATKDDAGIVAKLAVQLVDQHVRQDPARYSSIATLDGMTGFYGGQTEAENAAVLVAELDGRIVGFTYVGYEEISYEDLATKAAWIHDVFVNATDRHSGAGRALITAAIDFARAKGASKVLLWTAEQNGAAQHFFSDAGFATTMREMMLDLTEQTDG